MNKIDWIYYIILTMLVGFLIGGIFMSGCAALQHKAAVKDVFTVSPSPAVQLWYAAKASNWLVTMSILGIAGGVFATLNGQKWGMAVIVSCSVALFMSLAIARFAWWMAMCGLVGSVGLCVVSIMSRKRALVEIIKGGEWFRKACPEQVIDFKAMQAESQKSKSTQKIVKKIKGNLKVKGEI